MKKIIIIPLILLATGSLCAQDKIIYNSDGTTGPVPAQVYSEGKSIKVDVSMSNPDGTPKNQQNNYHQSIQSNDRVIKVDVDQVNPDGTPIGSVKPAGTTRTQTPVQTADDLEYRNRGNIDNPALIGKNENMPRSYDQNRNLIGKNENGPRKNDDPNASSYQSLQGQEASNASPTAETGRQISDVELNKMYPERKGHLVQPITGSNKGTTDAEKQKQIKPAPQVQQGTPKDNQGDTDKASK